MLIASLMFMAALAASAAEPTAPPSADPQVQAEAAKPQVAKPTPVKKVCVEEPQMGSHFSRKICATPEEWERRREQDAKTMAKYGEKNSVCTGGDC